MYSKDKDRGSANCRFYVNFRKIEDIFFPRFIKNEFSYFYVWLL